MVQYANRMDLLKGSEIRELLALTSKPDIISFAGGMPAPEPVSYTHLDVYKRQVVYIILKGPMPNSPKKLFKRPSSCKMPTHA